MNGVWNEAGKGAGRLAAGPSWNTVTMADLLAGISCESFTGLALEKLMEILEVKVSQVKAQQKASPLDKTKQKNECHGSTTS